MKEEKEKNNLYKNIEDALGSSISGVELSEPSNSAILDPAILASEAIGLVPPRPKNSKARGTKSMTSTPLVPKKKPGRPPKVLVSRRVHEGIVKEPFAKGASLSEEITCELTYANPQMFRRMFSIFKQFQVVEISFHFNEFGLKIFAKDSLDKNNIIVCVEGSRVHRYYCEKPLSIKVPLKDISSTMEAINKGYVDITFYTRRKNQMSVLTILVIHGEMNTSEIYRHISSEAEPIPGDVIIALGREETYPLKFSLDANYLKKLITSSSKMAEIISISKSGHEHVKLSYNYKSKKAERSIILSDRQKIQLKSKIADHEILKVSTHLENVKPMATALISDKIYISVHHLHEIVFTAYLDQKIEDKIPIAGSEVCVVKVFTPIIKSAKP